VNIPRGFKNKGSQLNQDELLRIVEPTLVETYGPEVLKQRPFEMSETKDSWKFVGTFPKGMSKGGVAEIEISKKDGSVLNVIHGK
jgi:hypothetical protein